MKSHVKLIEHFTVTRAGKAVFSINCSPHCISEIAPAYVCCIQVNVGVPQKFLRKTYLQTRSLRVWTNFIKSPLSGFCGKQDGSAAQGLESLVEKSRNPPQKSFCGLWFLRPFLQHSNQITRVAVTCQKFKALFSVNLFIILNPAELLIVSVGHTQRGQDLSFVLRDLIKHT